MSACNAPHCAATDAIKCVSGACRWDMGSGITAPKWVFLVQWEQDDGRCAEAFDSSRAARGYLEVLSGKNIRDGWITELAIRPSGFSG